jgi:putative polyhydroxyalkanoate system protein
MASIYLKRRHNLAKADARARVEEIARELQRKLNADYVWQGDSLTFSRPGVSGTIAVAGDDIEVNVKLAMIFAPMKGKIERAIVEHFDAALADDDTTGRA